MILVSAFGGVYRWLFYDLSKPVSAVITLAPVSYTHLTLPTTPYV